MNITKYLVVSATKSRYGNGFSTSKVELKEREPTLAGNEVAVRLNIEIPDAFFARPTLEAKLAIPAEAVPKSKITTSVTDNVEKLIKSATGLDFKVRIIEQAEEVEEIPASKSRRRVDAPEEESGDFTNFQTFRKGEKVIFFIKSKNDAYSGVHTITAVQKVEVGHIVQTDRSKNNWIHVHWFAPLRK